LSFNRSVVYGTCCSFCESRAVCLEPHSPPTLVNIVLRQCMRSSKLLDSDNPFTAPNDHLATLLSDCTLSLSISTPIHCVVYSKTYRTITAIKCMCRANRPIIHKLTSFPQSMSKMGGAKMGWKRQKKENKVRCPPPPLAKT